MDRSSPIVYGCRGFLNNSFTDASSTILPAYITKTLSTDPATTPSGDRSKAKFILSDVVQSSARERSAKLLQENPLYPEVTSLI